MKMLITVYPTEIDEILSALTAVLPPGRIHLFNEVDLPHSVTGEEKLIARIVDAIEPKRRQRCRAIALSSILRGCDTFQDLGDADNRTLRSAIASISKDLKNVFPADYEPISRISKKERRQQDGMYFGTKYWPTEFGKKILSELLKRGHEV